MFTDHKWYVPMFSRIECHSSYFSRTYELERFAIGTTHYIQKTTCTAFAHELDWQTEFYGNWVVVSSSFYRGTASVYSRF